MTALFDLTLRVLQWGWVLSAWIAMFVALVFGFCWVWGRRCDGVDHVGGRRAGGHGDEGRVGFEEVS